MADQDMNRRNFMVRAIFGVAAFISAVVAVPFTGFGILPALRKQEPGWSDAGALNDLAVNKPQERRFQQSIKSGWQEEKQERLLWLVRKENGSVVAFSPNCPHLGCGYRWFEAEQKFLCPCHGSAFDINGKVLYGPAPRPLDTLDAKVENTRVLVKYEVFQLGTGSKTAA